MNKADNTEAILDHYAQKISQMKLDFLVQFMVEAHIPLRSLAYTSALIMEPLAAPFIGLARMRSLEHILSDSKHIERFSDLIAHYAAEQKKPEQQA